MTPFCNIALYGPVTQFAIYFKVLASKYDSVMELSHARCYYKYRLPKMEGNMHDDNSLSVSW